MSRLGQKAPPAVLDRMDRAIVAATQAGLPLCARPYQAVGAEIGLGEEEVMARMEGMLAAGVIRRLGVVPNHYALGYKANGMSVWDIADQRIAALGALVGRLDFVTHCYHRPRHAPDWPYNLFAMVHGRDKDEVSRKVARIATLLGDENRGHMVLYSTRILKKTGLRIAARKETGPCSA